MAITDTRWVSKAPKLSHVASFDWIRGFGIFGVMIGHSFAMDTLSFAGIVDIFFVISGFLITTLLLQEHRRYGRIDLKKFYARRSLRLLPLLYVFLAFMGVAALVAKFSGLLDGTVYTLKELVKESLTAGLYVHNIFFPTLGGAWYGHLWTLSVEEQFYLVVGVFMVFGLARGWIKPVTWLLVGLVAAIQITRLFAITGPFKGLAMAVWLQRPDSLMVGMLAAIANAHIAEPMSNRTRSLMKVGGWIGAVGIFASVWASTSLARSHLGVDMPFWPGDPNYSTDPEKVVRKLIDAPGWRIEMDRVYWLQWGFTASNWSFFLVTLPAFRVAEWWPNKVMGWKPLARIGGLFSYGLYIWHYPVQHFTRLATGTTHDACSAAGIVNTTDCRPGDHYRMTGINPVLQLLLDCLLPFLLAVPAYYLVERKALEIKNRFQVERAAKAE